MSEMSPRNASEELHYRSTAMAEFDYDPTMRLALLGLETKVARLLAKLEDMSAKLEEGLT